MAEHFTKEDEGRVGTIHTVEQARAAHHLATADPEPERDGLMTGPAHEKKYGLERHDESKALWEDAGVHPYENRALVPGDEGYQPPIETADAEVASENTAAPRASRK